MEGVDLIDMLLSLYRINIRSKTYYMKVIYHLIDLSIVNGWLLYSNVQRPTQRGPPTVRLQSEKNSTPQNRQTRSVRPPPTSNRFDRFNHWLMSTTKGRCRYHGCNIVFKLLKENKKFLTSRPISVGCYLLVAS